MSRSVFLVGTLIVVTLGVSAAVAEETVLFDFEDVAEAECWSMMNIPRV